MRATDRNRTWPWVVCVSAGLIAATVAAHGAANHGELAPPSYYGEIARRIARHLPKEHLTRYPMDDVISGRSWTNYLASLVQNYG